MKFITYSEKETVEAGEKIAATLKPGDIVCLYGDLGAGKTTLAKGIARGFGIIKNVTSPTFGLMAVYDLRGSKLKLVHIDTYRLEDERELMDIGVQDYLGTSDSICVIEWPEKMKKLLKNKKTMDITIEHKNDTTRTIKVE